MYKPIMESLPTDSFVETEDGFEGIDHSKVNVGALVQFDQFWTHPKRWDVPDDLPIVKAARAISPVEAFLVAAAECERLDRLMQQAVYCGDIISQDSDSRFGAARTGALALEVYQLSGGKVTPGYDMGDRWSLD